MGCLRHGLQDCTNPSQLMIEPEVTQLQLPISIKNTTGQKKTSRWGSIGNSNGMKVIRDPQPQEEGAWLSDSQKEELT